MNMRKRLKGLLSLWLAAIMVAGLLLPVEVRAAWDQTHTADDHTNVNNPAKEVTLNGSNGGVAWGPTSFENGGLFYLGENINHDESTSVSISNKDVRLCLNGYKLSADYSGYASLHVGQGASLFVYDCNGSGEVTVSVAEGTVNIYGGKVTVNLEQSTGSVNIYDGEVTISSSNSPDATVKVCSSNVTLTTDTCVDLEGLTGSFTINMSSLHCHKKLAENVDGVNITLNGGNTDYGVAIVGTDAYAYSTQYAHIVNYYSGVVNVPDNPDAGGILPKGTTEGELPPAQTWDSASDPVINPSISQSLANHGNLKRTDDPNKIFKGWSVGIFSGSASQSDYVTEWRTDPYAEDSTVSFWDLYRTLPDKDDNFECSHYNGANAVVSLYAQWGNPPEDNGEGGGTPAETVEPAPPSLDEVPKTGENSDTFGLSAILMLSFGGLVIWTVRKRKLIHREE